MCRRCLTGPFHPFLYYPTSITKEQNEMVERLQMHALKCIFGSKLDGGGVEKMPDVITLQESGEELCLKIA